MNDEPTYYVMDSDDIAHSLGLESIPRTFPSRRPVAPPSLLDRMRALMATGQRKL